MPNSIAFKADTQTDWALAAAGKCTPLAAAKIPDWWAISGLSPSVDMNMTSPKVTQQKTTGRRGSPVGRLTPFRLHSRGQRPAFP